MQIRANGACGQRTLVIEGTRAPLVVARCRHFLIQPQYLSFFLSFFLSFSLIIMFVWRLEKGPVEGLALAWFGPAWHRNYGVHSDLMALEQRTSAQKSLWSWLCPFLVFLFSCFCLNLNCARARARSGRFQRVVQLSIDRGAVVVSF